MSAQSVPHRGAEAIEAMADPTKMRPTSARTTLSVRAKRQDHARGPLRQGPGGPMASSYGGGPSPCLQNLRDLPLAPRVESVVDEGPSLQKALIVDLDVQSTHPDRQQSRSQRVGFQILGDVCGMDNPGEPLERVVAELELLDQHLEGAEVGTVRV